MEMKGLLFRKETWFLNEDHGRQGPAFVQYGEIADNGSIRAPRCFCLHELKTD